MAPSFFSWLARGTSERTLPEAVSDWPGDDDRSNAFAAFKLEVERAAICWGRRRRANWGRADDGQLIENP